MCLWGQRRQIPGIHGHTKGNRSPDQIKAVIDLYFIFHNTFIPTLSPLWRSSPTWQTTTSPHGAHLNVVRTIIIKLEGPSLDYTCQQSAILGSLKLLVHSGWLLYLPAAGNHFFLTKVWVMGSYLVSTFISNDYHTLPHTSNRLRWQVNHHNVPTRNPCQPPKWWWLPYHPLWCHLTAKVKMLTQHNSDSILDTIKTLLEPEPKYAILRTFSSSLSLSKGSYPLQSLT